MAEATERAKFSLADGRIEIEGSEAFVAGQLAKLEPLLTKMFEQRTSLGASVQTSGVAVGNRGPASAAPVAAVGSGLEDYLNLFALADGKVQILKSLPGNGKSSKAQSATLLLAYANMLRGVTATTVEEIRNTCIAHACYDPGNFSKTFKGAFGKESLTLSGTGASQSLSLTHPGKSKATALADSINK